jgi:hypothetical protein
MWTRLLGSPVSVRVAGCTRALRADICLQWSVNASGLADTVPPSFPFFNVEQEGRNTQTGSSAVVSHALTAQTNFLPLLFFLTAPPGFVFLKNCCSSGFTVPRCIPSVLKRTKSKRERDTQNKKYKKKEISDAESRRARR